MTYLWQEWVSKNERFCRDACLYASVPDLRCGRTCLSQDAPIISATSPLHPTNSMSADVFDTISQMLVLECGDMHVEEI